MEQALIRVDFNHVGAGVMPHPLVFGLNGLKGVLVCLLDGAWQGHIKIVRLWRASVGVGLSQLLKLAACPLETFQGLWRKGPAVSIEDHIQSPLKGIRVLKNAFAGKGIIGVGQACCLDTDIEISSPEKPSGYPRIKRFFQSH